MERNGLRFGFLAYTYDQSNGNHKDWDERIALMDLERMRLDVAQLAARVDVVLVSMHAGLEYNASPNAQQVAFAHAAIDAGARVVVGHHPHVTQPWERYGKGVIFYSLGNLCSTSFSAWKRSGARWGRWSLRDRLWRKPGCVPWTSCAPFRGWRKLGSCRRRPPESLQQPESNQAAADQQHGGGFGSFLTAPTAGGVSHHDVVHSYLAEAEIRDEPEVRDGRVGDETQKHRHGRVGN